MRALVDHLQNSTKLELKKKNLRPLEISKFFAQITNQNICLSATCGNNFCSSWEGVTILSCMPGRVWGCGGKAESISHVNTKELLDIQNECCVENTLISGNYKQLHDICINTVIQNCWTLNLRVKTDIHTFLHCWIMSGGGRANPPWNICFRWGMLEMKSWAAQSIYCWV